MKTKQFTVEVKQEDKENFAVSLLYEDMLLSTAVYHVNMGNYSAVSHVLGNVGTAVQQAIAEMRNAK